MHAPRRVYAIATAVAVVALGVAGASSVAASVGGRAAPAGGQQSGTATPIKHLVVIFDENISFDHYFGTYPYAQNLPGENSFHAKKGTPTVNGLYNQLSPQGTPTGPLLTNNPNGPNANPVRLGPNVPLTCDQDHDYSAEQQAADHGAEDMYPKFTGSDLTVSQCLQGFTYKGQPEVPPPGTENDAAVMRLLRRQHGDRAMELRAALRDERQRLWDHLRSVDPRRAERDRRPDLRHYLRADVGGDQRQYLPGAAWPGRQQPGQLQHHGGPASGGRPRHHVQRRRPDL